mmetsp:Transcript_78033/g.218726  ORF Transcript_78033/g.218726 Transcript_78033/m.218726 type:complete len:358 (+) Transcript_78033:1331-2404(+)
MVSVRPSAWKTKLIDVAKPTSAYKNSTMAAMPTQGYKINAASGTTGWSASAVPRFSSDSRLRCENRKATPLIISLPSVETWFVAALINPMMRIPTPADKRPHVMKSPGPKYTEVGPHGGKLSMDFHMASLSCGRRICTAPSMMACTAGWKPLIVTVAVVSIEDASSASNVPGLNPMERVGVMSLTKFQTPKESFHRAVDCLAQLEMHLGCWYWSTYKESNAFLETIARTSNTMEMLLMSKVKFKFSCKACAAFTGPDKKSTVIVMPTLTMTRSKAAVKSKLEPEPAKDKLRSNIVSKPSMWTKLTSVITLMEPYSVTIVCSVGMVNWGTSIGDAADNKLLRAAGRSRIICLITCTGG